MKDNKIAQPDRLMSALKEWAGAYNAVCAEAEDDALSALKHAEEDLYEAYVERYKHTDNPPWCVKGMAGCCGKGYGHEGECAEINMAIPTKASEPKGYVPKWYGKCFDCGKEGHVNCGPGGIVTIVTPTKTSATGLNRGVFQ